MADKDVDVSVADDGNGVYSWDVDDVDAGKGNKKLKFKQAGNNKNQWRLTNISIWPESGADPGVPGSVVAPFTIDSVTDSKITVTDNDSVAATYCYRLYGKWGNTDISHDPKIINRGGM